MKHSTIQDAFLKRYLKSSDGKVSQNNNKILEKFKNSRFLMILVNFCSFSGRYRFQRLYQPECATKNQLVIFSAVTNSVLRFYYFSPIFHMGKENI